MGYVIGSTEQQLPLACLTHATFYKKWELENRHPPPTPQISTPSLYHRKSHILFCTFYLFFWALITWKTWAASSLVISPYQEIQMKLHSYRRLLKLYRRPVCLYRRYIVLTFLFSRPRGGHLFTSSVHNPFWFSLQMCLCHLVILSSCHFVPQLPNLLKGRKGRPPLCKFYWVTTWPASH